MKRFNLTFRGEVLPGYDPVVARDNFARLFAIDDRARTELFFSGKAVVLRRNLDSERARSWQLRMRSLGLDADLTAQTENAAAGGKLTAKAAQLAVALASGAAPAAAGSSVHREPNPYTLRPYQVGAAQRQRILRAAQLQQAGTVIAAAAALALALLLISLRVLPPPPAVSELVSAASHHQGELMLATSEVLLLHDRSGAEQETVPLRHLGVAGPLQDLLWAGPDTLLLLGEKQPGGNLYRCQLWERQCRLLADRSGPLQADAVAVNAATGQLIVADSDRSLLSLHGALGNRLASAERALPKRPVLRIHDGLLLASSAEGPGISVLRYEPESFARQLDEILLLPPTGLEAGLGSVNDFASSGEQWWATLENPDTGAAGVFRFDTLWNFLGNVALPPAQAPGALVPWGTRMLMLDRAQGQLLRFSAAGEPGLALASPYVQGLTEARQNTLALRERLQRWGTILLLLLTLVASLFSLWQRQRQRVFAAHRQRSAPPLGSRSSEIVWLPPLPQRLPRLPVWLGLRQNHLGVIGKQLILVDHRGVYHVGNGIHLQQHPLFLKAEDVIIYTGPPGRRAFAAEAWQLVEPALTAASDADTGTVLVALLESRHPLALAATGLLVALLAGALLVLF